MRLAWCLLVPVLVGAALLAACDSGGGMDGANGGDGDENSAPSASATANATDVVVGDTVRLNASESSDPDGHNLSYNWTLDRPAGSDATLSSPTAVDPWFVPDTASSDGGYTAEVEVVENTEDELSDTDNVSVTAKKQLPETVTVEFANRANPGDTLIAGTLELAGEVVTEAGGEASGSFTAASSRETKQLCFTENDLFSQYCETVSLTGDISVELRPDRKTVSFTVIPDPPYGNPAETKVTMYEPFKADSTKFTGKKTVERPKRSDGLTRKVKTDLKTDDPEKSGALDRLVADTTVTANSDVELYAQPSLVPACSDNINSDQDPFEKDTNEPGCYNDEGTEYNPDDDNELHSLRQRLTGVNFDDSTLVSGRPDERSLFIRDSDLPESVTVANGQVDMTFRNKRLSDVSKQGFRIRIESRKCDASEYQYSQTSNKVADPDAADGWKATPVHGLARFGERCYKVVLEKAKPFGDSENIVLHYAPNEDNDLGIHSLSYYYEPDHPELSDGNGKMAGLNTAPQSGQCRIADGGKSRVCTNVRIENLPPLLR